MKKSKREPSRKLGVKFLDKYQMFNTFPDYTALMQRIESQRTMLMNAQNMCNEPWNWAAPPMYDNVYAIMGGRGTGKSSVLLTLWDELNKKGVADKSKINYRDILFPIITPEIFSDNHCSFLGWIIAVTELIVDETENMIRLEERRSSIDFSRKDFDSRCGTDFFSDCAFQRQNILRRSYEELCEISQSGWNASGLAYEDEVNLRIQNSRSQYKLRQKLKNFWKLLTDVRYELQKTHLGNSNAMSNGTDSSDQICRPMIIMMFDDIDLVPERSMELLTTTFQFLSDINIVIILTAAERVLKQVLYMKMHERMIGSNYRSLLQEFYANREKQNQQNESAAPWRMDTPEKMMIEFYNKVIPPANRYHLHRYDTILERTKYSYSCMDQSFVAPKGDEEVSTKLEDFLRDQIWRLYAEFGQSSKDNFIVNNKSGEPHFRRAYLLMFGSKNRNIANGCLEIMNVISRICMLHKEKVKKGGWVIDEQICRDIEASMRHLMRSLILSKDETNRYGDNVDSLIHAVSDNQSIYIEYAALMSIYDKEREQLLAKEESDPENDIKHGWAASVTLQRELANLKKRIGAIMVMMFFIENILLLFDSDRKEVHGYRELTELLNADILLKDKDKDIVIQGMPLRLFRAYQSVDEFLDESVLVFEHVDLYTGFSPFKLKYVQDYLQNLSGLREYPSAQFLANRIDVDREWVHTVLMMLFVRNSGITFVDSTFLLSKTAESSCRLFEMFDFGGKLNSAIRRTAKEFLQNPRFERNSTALMKKFDEMLAGNPVKKGYNNIKEYILNSQSNKKDENEEEIRNTIEKFFECTLHSTIKREKYYKKAVAKIPNLIELYFAFWWNTEYPEDRSPGSLENWEPWGIERCYRLISFVEEKAKVIERVIKARDSWYLYLKKYEAEELYNTLNELVNFELDMKRQKDTIFTELQKIIGDNKSDDNKSDDNKSNDNKSGDNEIFYPFPADDLMQYLIQMDTFLLDSDGNEFLPEYILYENRAALFNAIGYLRLYEKDVKKQLMDGIPATAHIILDVKMLEYLQPYYLAAKFGIQLKRRYKSELSFLKYDKEDKGMHRDLTETDRMLGALYDNLCEEDDAKCAEVEGTKNNDEEGMKRLRKLMTSVREDTAEQYYRKLEERK